MGSKAPPLSKHTPLIMTKEENLKRSASDTSPRLDMLRRITEALHLAPGALYNPPNAVTPRPETRADGDDEALVDVVAEIERDCAALLHAFRRIQDREERYRLLTLVLMAAERS